MVEFIYIFIAKKQLGEVRRNIKILILGASGMLGHVTGIRLKQYGHKVIELSKSRKLNDNTVLMDIKNIADFNSFLDDYHFDVIVNCIALLVSESEKTKDTAVLLNSYLPHFLEAKYLDSKTKIIQVGTDSIFSGKNNIYDENSPHDATNFYSRTKSLGEICNHKDLTVRSAFWGPDISEASQSIFNWSLCNSGTINGYRNHIFNGVSSLVFAEFVQKTIIYDISGIYHLTSKEPISKLDFLFLINHTFNTKTDIVPIDYDIAVRRVLLNNCININFPPKNYTQMMFEIKDWIHKNKCLYSHYTIDLS